MTSPAELANQVRAGLEDYGYDDMPHGPAVDRKECHAALSVLEARLEQAERALGDARFILTPLAHKDTAHDAWQLDRARWHWQYGDRALAEKEFADIQTMRQSNLWSHPGQEEKYRAYPDDALEQPIAHAIARGVVGETSEDAA